MPFNVWVLDRKSGIDDMIDPRIYISFYTLLFIYGFIWVMFYSAIVKKIIFN